MPERSSDVQCCASALTESVNVWCDAACAVLKCPTESPRLFQLTGAYVAAADRLARDFVCLAVAVGGDDLAQPDAARRASPVTIKRHRTNRTHFTQN